MKSIGRKEEKMKIESTGKKKRKAPLIIILSVVVLLIAGAVAAVIWLFPKKVEVTRVVKGNVSRSVSEIGKTEADDAITIYSPISGKISEVDVAVNDYVSSNTILVKYSLQNLEEQLNAAELNTKYQQDGYNAAVSKNNEYRQMLNRAQIEEEANKNTYQYLGEQRDNLAATEKAKSTEVDNMLKALDANLASLTSQLQVAQAKLEATDPSDTEGIAKIKEEIGKLEKQIKDNRNAMAGYSSGTMSNEDYKQYLALVRQMEYIDRFWNTNIQEVLAAKQAILPQSQMDQYAVSVQLAEAEQMRIQRDMEVAKRGVPMECSGTILERLVDEGALVEAGQPLFVIQPDAGYKASVMISKYDIGLIEAGQKASVVYGNETFEGEVKSVSPVAENDASGKPKVKVIIAFNDAAAKPIIGLETEVSIKVGEKEDVLSVSSKAVYTGDQGDYVYVLNNGVIEKRNITVGLKGNESAEILDGLKEGDLVITTPVSEDKIGSRARAGQSEE
ncbi:MAG: HlyD family efflux transporter periplasmic adaptor subunit [Lachnospiraceae bacterium]|nr:HlyD family efflux transporter periplasmic adaptor subunit [Lachnospiraceae bacterium]